jgi:[lysine-biosynthesis-protein LysW]---L-2-aminoadipate ligase
VFEQAEQRLAVLASRVRVEEKMIFSALEHRRIPYDQVDERTLGFLLGATHKSYTALLNRSIAHTRSLYVTRLLERSGILVMNSSKVIEVCGDKLLTSLALSNAQVPIPRTAIAFSQAKALELIEEIGYPVVLKPITGSWGRLLAKVNDRDAAEAILEHKSALSSPQHSVMYIQEYIPKTGRDIRTIVIGDQVLCAMYRYAEHWITNTARGGKAQSCPITPKLAEISLKAARAVGGGILAIDILEHADALLVNEVNHTMEFHGMSETTGIDIAGAIVDYIWRSM